MENESGIPQGEVPPPKDPSKVFAIAGLYYQGLTVPEDKVKASQLYELSADRGYAPAMVRLGIMKMEGDGIEQDDVGATALFQRAADAGNSNGMFLLALRYADGIGIPQDCEMAAKWCFEAAKAGSHGAMVELAIWFRDGKNHVRVDMEQCLYWLIKASLDEYPNALYELGCMYAFGESVVKDVENGKHLLQHAVLRGDDDAADALKALDAGASERP